MTNTTTTTQSEDVSSDTQWMSYAQIGERWGLERHAVMRMTARMLKLRLGNRVRVDANQVYDFERRNLVRQQHEAHD
jgi:hypothetical protein